MKKKTTLNAKLILMFMFLLMSGNIAVAQESQRSLKDYLRENFDAMATVIDLTSYNLDFVENESKMFTLISEIRDEYPELDYFMCSSPSLSNKNGKLASISLWYYDREKEKFDEEVSKAMSQINDDMTDLEKIVAIHDYVCGDVTYNWKYNNASITEQLSMGNLRAAILDKKPICLGYQTVFYYYMRLLNIKTTKETRYNVNHAWNTVYVEGKPYLIDLTWDDYDTGDIVSHTYMLKSASVFGHTLVDTDTLRTFCTSDTFDKAFWSMRQVQGNIAVANHNFYYTDNGTIYKHSSDIDDISSSATAVKTLFYSKTNVAAHKNKVYYTDYKGVYELDLSTNEGTLIHSCSSPTKLRIAKDIAYYTDGSGKEQSFPLGSSAIENITKDCDEGDGVYYNIMGQPVSNPTPGIYVRNGKKVIVRN